MTTEQMTVHKALSELKTLDSRIEKGLDTTLIDCAKHSAKKIDGLERNAYAAMLKGNLQSISDLINRKHAIKQAVVNSNSTAVVVINEMQLTVAEAIDYKNKYIPDMQWLLETLSKNYDRVQRKVEKENGRELDIRAEEYVKNMFGDKGQCNTEDVEKLREIYLQNNAFDLIDPNNSVEFMKQLSNKIDKFLVEVDSALSVSNALTIIDIEY